MEKIFKSSNMLYGRYLQQSDGEDKRELDIYVDFPADAQAHEPRVLSLYLYNDVGGKGHAASIVLTEEEMDELLVFLTYSKTLGYKPND